MKARKIFWCIAFLFCVSLIQAQVISSEKSYLQVKSKSEKMVSQEIDQTPPEIKLITPLVENRSGFNSNESEVVIIGKVTDKSGVSSLLVNSKVSDVTDAGIFTSMITLTPGENEITIVAMDNEDNFVDFRFSVNYAPVKLTLAETVSKESDYYALIIGINNYADPAIRSLDNPLRDAQNLYTVLTTHYTFDKDKIQFLKDARRGDIIYSLDYLARTVTSNDNLLIFYAGHGTFDEKANIGYWLPSDARKISKADWFRNSTLVDYLKEIETKHTLLITDACFGGSIFKMRSAFADTPKAIEKLYELPSRKAMTSGTLTEVPDQSSFAKYLVERLEANKEKYISSQQLFSSLRIAVINNSDAIPQYGEIRNVGDQGGDFIFIKK